MSRLNRTYLQQDAPLSQTQFHLRNHSFQFEAQGYKNQQHKRLSHNESFQQSISRPHSNKLQKKKHILINYDQTFRNVNNARNFTLCPVEKDKENVIIKQSKKSKQRNFSQYKNNHFFAVEESQKIDKRVADICGLDLRIESLKNSKNKTKSRVIQLEQCDSVKGRSTCLNQNAQQMMNNTISQELYHTIQSRNRRAKNFKRAKQNSLESILFNYGQEGYKAERRKHSINDKYRQQNQSEQSKLVVSKINQDEKKTQKQIFKILQKNLIPFFMDQLNDLQLRLTHTMEKRQQKYSSKLQGYHLKIQQNSQKLQSFTNSLQQYQQQNNNLRALVQSTRNSIQNMNEQREKEKRKIHELQQKIAIKQENKIGSQTPNEERMDSNEQLRQIIGNEGFLEALEEKIQQILHSNRLEIESFQKAVYEQSSQLQQNMEELKAQFQALKKKVNKRLSDFRIQQIELKGQLQQKSQKKKKKLGTNKTIEDTEENQEERVKFSQQKFSKIQKIVRVYNDNFLQITKRLEFLQANIPQLSSARDTVQIKE